MNANAGASDRPYRSYRSYGSYTTYRTHKTCRTRTPRGPSQHQATRRQRSAGAVNVRFAERNATIRPSFGLPRGHSISAATLPRGHSISAATLPRGHSTLHGCRINADKRECSNTKTSRGRQSACVCTAACSPAGSQMKVDQCGVSPCSTPPCSTPAAPHAGLLPRVTVIDTQVAAEGRHSAGPEPRTVRFRKSVVGIPPGHALRHAGRRLFRTDPE